MRSEVKRRQRRNVIAVFVAVAMLVGAPAAFAGKGGNGNGGGSDIWIMDSSLEAAAADGYMHFLDPVSFGYSTKHWDAERGTGPWLRLQCYQDGALVYWETRAGFEGGYNYGVPFQLGPSLSWTGGEADCTGILGHKHRNGKFMVEATVDFDVMP